MSHIDRVLPGAVHRVSHEDMVADTDAQVRLLLESLACRSNRLACALGNGARGPDCQFGTGAPSDLPDGVDQWRDFDPFLGELRAGLGDLVLY